MLMLLIMPNCMYAYLNTILVETFFYSTIVHTPVPQIMQS